MVVCLLMPTTKQKHDEIRRKLMFELVTSQAPLFIEQGAQKDNSVTQFHKQIGLPASWFQSSIGLVLQSLNLYELALQAWLNEANVQQAHNIWYEKIMPLYMTKSSGVDLARALMFDSELEQAERAELIKR